MVRCRGSVVNRCGGRFVGCRFVGLVFGFTRVLNISNISAITINTVIYSLDSAIGKGNIVASRGSISITLCRVVIFDSILVCEGLRGEFCYGMGCIGSGCTIGGGCIGNGSGTSGCYQGRENQNLKV